MSASTLGLDSMGYIPPKPVARQVGDVRIEFVMTAKGWHHCWTACISSKKCKWLSPLPLTKLHAV